jgi:hypothetical protein
MPAENVSGVDEVTPEPEPTGPDESSRDRRGDRIWATLAAVLLAAIVLLILLSQCVPRVPDVVGLAQKQAETTLVEAGYEVGSVSKVALTGTPAGRVAEQAPGAGVVFAHGGSVDLIVALGADLVVVPDVVGRDTPAAELLIRAKGLTMEVSGQYSDTIPAGAIISQYPLAGTKVRIGTQVLVVVSLGIAPESDTGSGASSGGAGASGGGGSGSSTAPSKCTAAYPRASVWSSGGDIYIRLAPGGGTRRLTSGSSWDTSPLLSPSAKYVVFMRAPSNGAKSTDIGRVCLTDFDAQILKMPWSTQMTAGYVWYDDYVFAPSPRGTAPGSDWLVVAQIYEYPMTSAQHPDPALNLRGRLNICNVPIASSWVSWNEQFWPTASIALSRSTRAGCVKVTARRADGSLYVRDFNAYNGKYFK